MSDPARWVDGVDSPGGVRDLLLQAKKPAPLPAAVRARSAAALHTRLATPPGRTPWHPWTGAWSAKGLAGILLLAVAAVGVARHRRPHASAGPQLVTTQPRPHSEPAPDPSTPREDAVPSRVVAPSMQPAEASDPVRSAVSPPTVPTPIVRTHGESRAGRSRRPHAEEQRSIAESTSTVATQDPAPTTPDAPEPPAVAPEPQRPGESALLARAQSRLARDPAHALTDLEEHASLYPNGRLRDEREAMIVDALHRLHREADARVRANAFLQRFPDSLYAPRVRSIVEEDGR